MLTNSWAAKKKTSDDCECFQDPIKMFNLIAQTPFSMSLKLKCTFLMLNYIYTYILDEKKKKKIQLK